jgi:hypothetical protein
MKCQFCKWFYESQLVLRGKEFVRYCKVKNEKITSDTEACKYFNPTSFHCDKYDCRLTFSQCLSRRRNEKKLRGYLDCAKCRQWDNGIREIALKYFIDQKPIITPRNFIEEVKEPEKRTIKRRGKKDRETKEKPESERKIKRRCKEVKEPEKRTIKRRGKNKEKTIKRRRR